MNYNLEKHGFEIIKGVFTFEQIQDMRLAIKKTFKRLEKLDLIEKNKGKNYNFSSTKIDVIQQELEEFDYIIFNKNYLKAIKSLIGPDIAYMQDSSIQIGTGYTGYHKDNISRDDKDHDDWKSNYDVIRGALYFQNTKDYSGGVNIRIGSHKHANLFSGKAINVPLEEGDLIFWKLTSTHSGNAKRLKFFPNLSLFGRIQRLLPDYFFIAEQLERMALFASFGKPGIHYNNYERYLRSKTSDSTRKNSKYSKKSRELAQQNNIILTEY
tara:strand:+ start:408 stop:1211 length:804 start_codon:yes stop_codon:yes gene_type:complete